jgi:hypothetical protein
MDAAFFKTVGLAVLAILFVIGAGYFLKEDFDIRRKGGATVSQAVIQALWSYAVRELLPNLLGSLLALALVIGIGVGFVGLMIMGWREVIEIITSLENAKP